MYSRERPRHLGPVQREERGPRNATLPEKRGISVAPTWHCQLDQPGTFFCPDAEVSAPFSRRRALARTRLFLFLSAIERLGRLPTHSREFPPLQAYDGPTFVSQSKEGQCLADSRSARDQQDPCQSRTWQLRNASQVRRRIRAWRCRSLGVPSKMSRNTMRHSIEAQPGFSMDQRSSTSGRTCSSKIQPGCYANSKPGCVRTRRERLSGSHNTLTPRTSP